MNKELDRITEQQEDGRKENPIFEGFDDKLNDALKRHEEFIKSIKKQKSFVLFGKNMI